MNAADSGLGAGNGIVIVPVPVRVMSNFKAEWLVNFLSMAQMTLKTA